MLDLQLVLRLDEVRVRQDAAGLADGHALRLVLGTHALGAAQRVDDVDRVADRDRLVGAYRLAGVEGGAVVVDQQGHGRTSRRRQAATAASSWCSRECRKASYSAAPIAPG
jgi:hypothetical protein